MAVLLWHKQESALDVSLDCWLLCFHVEYFEIALLFCVRQVRSQNVVFVHFVVGGALVALFSFTRSILLSEYGPHHVAVPECARSSSCKETAAVFCHLVDRA